MTAELAVIDGGPDISGDLIIRRPPEVVVEEAMRAAKVLKTVLDGKARKVVFNGEQYIENEDWQTIGRFYGLCARVTDCRFVEAGDAWGYEARAVALRTDGGEVSEAFASCFSDEQNWRNRPRFMLQSMAQTRACSKALRNVLAFVPVLAGYRPTPAEEMDGMAQRVEQSPKPAPTPKDPKTAAARRLAATMKNLGIDWTHEKEFVRWMASAALKRQVESMARLTADEAATLIEWLAPCNSEVIKQLRGEFENQRDVAAGVIGESGDDPFEETDAELQERLHAHAAQEQHGAGTLIDTPRPVGGPAH